MIAKKNGSRFNQEDSKRRYYGKYRGTVVNNYDPSGQGRLQVMVPEVSPVPLINWAMMCTPVGGFQNGMFAVPPPKSGVWVEFEQGDIDYPIWTGCFIGAGFEAPKQAPTPNPVLQAVTLQTPTQNCLVIDDSPGIGIEIRLRGRTKISIKDATLEITNGLGASIKMEGPKISINALQVDINSGALTIT
jgi:uncharacterized protein involved in type VI secretion and phage assembly